MKAEILIDWCTFTVKDSKDPRAVIRDWLDMSPDLFESTGYGLMGYGSVLKFGDIMVCYDGREDQHFSGMGVCVSMSGNGCRQFEQFNRKGFPDLFRRLAVYEQCNVTRIDVACDDHAGYLDMDTIIDHFQRNLINSRMTRRQVVISYDGVNRAGATCYLGSPSSQFRTRIYDKAAEQEQDDHWIRVELVLRGKHAMSFVKEISSGSDVGSLAVRVINDKFSFVEGDHTRVENCGICDWWANFLEDLSAVHLVTRCESEHRVDRIHDWVFSQCAPSIYILVKCFGRGVIDELSLAGRERLSSQQEEMIADYLNLLSGTNPEALYEEV